MGHIIISVVQDILWGITGLTVLNALWYLVPRPWRRTGPAAGTAQARLGRHRNDRAL